MCRSRSAAARHPGYREEDGQRVMKQSEITVRVRAASRRGVGDGLDLRSVARLRQHQRRNTAADYRFERRAKKPHRLPRPATAVPRASTALVERAGEAAAAPAPPPTDWKASIAFRWRKRDGRGRLQPVTNPHRIGSNDLRGIDAQKRAGRAEHPAVRRGLSREQRAAHRRARHRQVIAREGAAQQYAHARAAADRGGEAGPRRPARIVERHAPAPERFILYCDDLSFEADEPGYKALKVVLDGSVAAASENCLIYATSNRRHLMPEYMQENLETSTSAKRYTPARRRRRKSRSRSASACGCRSIRSTRTSISTSSRYWVAHFKARGDALRGRAPRGAPVGAAARLAQRPRGVAVRARLGAAEHGGARAGRARARRVVDGR